MTTLADRSFVAVAIQLTISVIPTSADDAQTSSFREQLRHVNVSFKGGPFTDWKRVYDLALPDKMKWQSLVQELDDADTRTSRAAEMIAFSGRYRVESVKIGNQTFPVRSKGGGLLIFAYRPVEQMQDGKWVKLPERIRKRRYLLVRGAVPFKDNPYGVVTSTYLSDLTDQQIMKLVNASRQF